MPTAKIISVSNQKGGTGKSTTAVNLGVGLARQGKKVLVVDLDPQGDATTCLGWKEQDNLPVTLSILMRVFYTILKAFIFFRGTLSFPQWKWH